MSEELASEQAIREALERDGNASVEIPHYLIQPGDGPRRSILMSLLEQQSSRRILRVPGDDPGLAEHLPYPFMALVGQVEMRTALLLAIINPNVGGVLLIGPRGTGKTTAARSLSDLLPLIETSTCPYGCMPEDYAISGRDGVCDVCADQLEAGQSITRQEPVRLIELPLNARLDDVVGGVNERAAVQDRRIRLDRGILARADRNLLYVDEVNLLADEIVDAILDAAAQGHFTVRRGPMKATYRSRFVLIGSMNPEEGRLRPQILDRFGLRLTISGLMDSSERKEIYERVRSFRMSPRSFIHLYEEETFYAREDIVAAQTLLPNVQLTPEAEGMGFELVRDLAIHSHRAEFTMFEAARAYAAADGRDSATVDDVCSVAPMALRLRNSAFMDQYFDDQRKEDEQLVTLIRKLGSQYGRKGTIT